MEKIQLPIFDSEAKTKVSDLIASYIEKIGVKDVFVLTGGCAVHIIDSINSNVDLNVIPMLHEQSCSMAADAYSRIADNNYSVVVTTSGPGATNLLTGVCCSFYDSIPSLYITGQVPSNQLKNNSELRQFGFQETDVISIFKSVTKLSAQVKDPTEILYLLDKAYFTSKTGRPGPVLLDICDDVQRAEVVPKQLERYSPQEIKQDTILEKNKDFDFEIERIIEDIKNSKRPVLVLGGGIKNPNDSELYVKFVEQNKIPFLLTWGAIDIVPHTSKYFAGTFGVTATRAGNFVIQNADLIIGLGARFDTHEIGNNTALFAPNAKKIFIDIDKSELKKFENYGPKISRGIVGDCQIYLNSILDSNLSNVNNVWLEYIDKVKNKFLDYKSSEIEQDKNVNPYFFISSLSDVITDDSIIIPDCGSNLIWAMQAIKIKSTKNKFFSAFNHSPMGYALPAAFGASICTKGKRQVICITGDGGLMINVQELATLKRNSVNCKLVIMNNHGHGIIQGTQDSWLEGRHVASNFTGGLPDPDYLKIIESYGIPVEVISNNNEVKSKLKNFLAVEGLSACILEMNEGSQIYPKLMYGLPLQESSPQLDKRIIKELMEISNFE